MFAWLPNLYLLVLLVSLTCNQKQNKQMYSSIVFSEHTIYDLKKYVLATNPHTGIVECFFFPVTELLPVYLSNEVFRNTVSIA